VVLIGAQNRLEVWDAKRWNKYMTQHGPRFDAVAEKAFQK
jgi:DNA-binding transcriptional regulator/RsmH inhibitor MraZ